MAKRLFIILGIWVLIPLIVGAQFIVTFPVSQPELLEAHAGASQLVATGTLVTLGDQPAATGGTQPYAYLWEPGYGLSDSTLPNPVLTADTSITYTLTVTDTEGCTATSTVQINLLTGIPGNDPQAEKFSIFPNPLSGGKLLVRGENRGKEEYEVVFHTLQGKELLRKTLSGAVETISMDIGFALPPGVYMVTVRCSDEYHFKLIVP